MENEIMNNVEEVMENSEVVTNSNSGLGMGVLIGTALCAAGYAVTKGVKKGIAWYKAKKEEKATILIDNTNSGIEDDVIE